jgi:cellulose synthase/poly-beta-1,6-N-acetylglucosamine synthase-like glycosyltransferase
VQCRYTTLNADSSLRTRLMNLALMAFNALRPRGRSALGLSAGILGNGFALAASTLRRVPYGAESVVEDLEYHLLLVRAGLRVRFTDAAWVKADMPTGGGGSRTQRARWEGGRLLMLRQHVPALLRGVIAGRWRLLEPALDLLLLPLAYHVLLLAITAALPVGFARVYGLMGLGLVALHVLVAIRVGGGSARDLLVLAAAPAYILWKLTVLRLIRRSAARDAAWVRTHRETGDSTSHD